VDEESAAETIGGVIDSLLLPATNATVLLPPVRGLAFLADPDCQDDLDEWWRTTVPPSATLIYLIEQSEGLPQWLDGLDGLFFIRCTAAASRVYEGCESIRPIVAGSTMLFVSLVLTQLADELGIFNGVEASRLVVFATLAEPGRAAHLRNDHTPSASYLPEPMPEVGAATAHPFDLLADMLPA